jgi:hypothetical protein
MSNKNKNGEKGNTPKPCRDGPGYYITEGHGACADVDKWRGITRGDRCARGE